MKSSDSAWGDSSPDVTGLGALNWDLIYELPDLARLTDLGISLSPGEEIHLGPDALDPLLNLLDRYGRKRAESGGGQAANTIVALAGMGFRTRMLGKVGNDRWGDLILAGLKGVDVSSVIRENRSGMCISILTPDGERSMIAFPNANDTLDFEDIAQGIPSGCLFLHLTSFAGPRPLKAQIELVKHLDASTLITFDPGNLYAGKGLDQLLPVIERTYCLFATDAELERITGFRHQEAAARMLDLGVRMVVCKQGARGAYLLDSTGCRTFSALAVEVKDVTGAGDCFAAGFLAGLIRGQDLDTCGAWGTRAAASCITGYGRERYPGKEILVRENRGEVC
ncbi:MAG: carbohydrate kinase family protein [bacterium]